MRRKLGLLYLGALFVAAPAAAGSARAPRLATARLASLAVVPLKTESLRGVVYGPDGAPAAGAVVWAARHTYGPLESRQTNADQHGRYNLELPPGEWYVWARRGTQGGEGQGRHTPVMISTDTPPLTIRLEERGLLRGRLLEAETGKPISGGRLFLDAGFVLTADDDGKFQIGGLYRSAHEAFVVAPGRMRMRVLFDTSARADTELDVPVPAAGKIVGRVTDIKGRPIVDAYVGRSTSGSFFSINGLYVACDAMGRFEYDDAVPPDQPTRLTAGAPGYVSEQRGELRVPMNGKPLEVHFRLRPEPDDRPGAPKDGADKRRTVSGLVRGPAGNPLAGVVVRWGYQPYAGAITGRTDAKGRFSLLVPDEAKLLAVLSRDFPPAFPPVAAGGDQKIEVALNVGHTAAGRVVDEAGKPLRDVLVIAIVSSPDPRLANPFWLSESSVHTDADGRFEMKGIPGGARFDFLKSGLDDLRGQTLNLDGGDNTISMLHGGAVTGRLLDQQGKPIRSFRVLVGFPRNRLPGDKTEGFFAGYSGMGVRFTSADGSFVLSGVGAGSVYRLTAIADGHGEAIVDRVIAVPTNRLPTTAPAILQAGPRVSLRVRVAAADGKPISGARVALINGEPGLDKSFGWGYDDANWNNMVRARAGTDGWADFPSLSFGGATVLVQAPGFGRSRVAWRNGQKELTVTLTPEAVVKGVVRDAAGIPLEEYSVSMTCDGNQIHAGIGPNENGRFRIGELAQGTWKFVVHAADGLTVLNESEVQLRPGETKDLAIFAE